MRIFFKQNIDNRGRLLRGVIALALFVGAGFCFFHTLTIAGVALVAAGVFVSFEALRGWCAVRACGIKTKL